MCFGFSGSQCLRGEGQMNRIKIIGAGLAGSEAAWQCARRGVPVDLYEMRPVRSTPAHQTADFAELVCSNSLKSESENTAPWLLKEEMRRSGSLLIEIARECAVPAGHALAVDRTHFSARVTETISREPLIRIRREEATQVREAEITIIATGPLTSDALVDEIARLADGRGSPPLHDSAGDDDMQEQRAGEAPTPHSQPYFYDSISPIVEADSIDMSKVYLAARYDKGSADYINCPMSKEEYDRFYDALVSAESVEAKDWEKLNYFESCLPIEEIARRGRDTLRFGPMKPVGLNNPQTGKMPYAVVQLRQENLRADSYNLVGFQNHLKFGVQAQVLRLIPGLENARFLRFGQIHRNTYINSPTLLTSTLQMKEHPAVLFAGQICGVEGYVESIATGMLAGFFASTLVERNTPVAAPRATAMGSLVHYITHADPKKFQPANITFDLLPPLERKIRDRQQRRKMQCEFALRELEQWLKPIQESSLRAG
ncbi:MAG: gid protein [Acidobacteriaceae bacterium]|nr:gid protein [Acidobacteriaceae bacterium]